MPDDRDDLVSSTASDTKIEKTKRSAIEPSHNTFSKDDSERRGRPTTSSSSAAAEANTPLMCSGIILPHSTGDWTNDHLNSLGIDIILNKDLKPEEIINKVYDKLFVEPDKAQRFKEHILKYAPRGWKKLENYDNIQRIFGENIDKLKDELTSEKGSCWRIKNMEYSERFFTERFHVMGEMFGRYLVSLARLYKSGEIITELMYRTLFSYFSSMFGFICDAVPSLAPKKMKIKSTLVTSSPDMLLLQSQKIMAPVKVKRNLSIEDNEQSPPPKLRKTDDLSPNTRKIRHLDNGLIGQIGGELLIHLPSSAGHKNKILGIIIQETNITFAYLKRKLDLEKENNTNEEGDMFLKGNYIMKFSEPYNYLDPEMRKRLMVPLLLLGFLQNCEFPDSMTL